MSSTRHEFIVTASDRTKVAFDSAKAGFLDMKKTAISATSAIAAGLGGVGVVAFTKEMADMGEQSLLAADRLNTTTEQITSLQYAASKFGIDGESMNAVLQDMSVRIQEFANIGTGEGADFFEGLNLNVQDFIDLAPDQLLYKVAKELENVSDASARVYLDQLGSDNLVALLPALRNGAQGLRELQDEAYVTNKVLKEADAIKLASIANEINIMQNATKSLSQQLAAEFEPAVKAISQTFNAFASDGEAVSDTLDIMATSGTLVASVYAGRMTSAFISSAQAKYADTMATRQSAAANVEEAKAVLAKAEVKLSTEKKAYQDSIVAKQQDAAASERLSAENLALAKTTKAAAAADVEAAKASKAHAEQLGYAKLRAEKLKIAEAELSASKDRLSVATKRAEKAEQAHQAQIAKNTAAIQVATDNTKRLDRAKGELERSTKKLTTAQNVHNASMRAGSIAARGLSAALGLVGGPLGLLFTGMTAISLLNSDIASGFDVVTASSEDFSENLKNASANDLETMLKSVRSELALTNQQIESIDARKAQTGFLAITQGLNDLENRQQKPLGKLADLQEKEAALSAALGKRQTLENAKQAAIRQAIASQELKTNITNLQDASKTLEQIRRANYDKELADIQQAEDKKLLTASQADSLRYSSKQRYELQEEQLEVAQRQKRLAAFSDNYTKREQMTLEHQQRVLAYMQENGITNDQDARVIAYQQESYDYQLKMFQEFQDGILKQYDDYGKSELQKEKDRYAEEIKLLDKHLRDKDITQQQYDKAKSVADDRAAKNRKIAEQQDLEISLNKQREFNDLFVGMADSKNKELAAIGKAAAIYNIGINTYQGAMAAYAALAPIPIVGPALGIAASAALVAYGAEQVGQVNNQTYHTGGIAGQKSDDYSARLAANEVPAVLIKGEEVLTQSDPRHRNNLTMAKSTSSESAQGSTVNQMTFGDIVVQVTSNNPQATGTDIGEQVAEKIVAVLQSKLGQQLIYSGVSAEAGRNGGKIKGVR